MSRWIDADALKDRLDFCVKEGMGSTIAYTFKHMVDEAPSIDIVRCKECKRFGDEGWCFWRDVAIKADDFCSYGERRGQ